MRYTWMLLLAACAADERKYCSESLTINGLVRYSSAYEGRTVPGCDQWCVGKNVGSRCSCKESCPCKRIH